MIHDLIGLIPAAGQAMRISPLPCSKELYPVGFRTVDGNAGLRPKVVSHYLLEKMQLAGIARAYIVLRNGKWDIPAYLGDGAMLNMHLAYLMMRLPFGQPYTLDQAYPFVQDAMVALGFPDVIFQPDDAFTQLLARRAQIGADVVLGLFRANRPQNSDMVEVSDSGRVRAIRVKPSETNLNYTWIIAVWAPTFTRFMHEYLAELESKNIIGTSADGAGETRELFVGDVMQAAIENNLHVEGVLFPHDNYLDIGTPEDLVEASRKYGMELNRDCCVN